MCNCNQKRTTTNFGNQISNQSVAKVKLITEDPVTITGNITGRQYAFRYVNEINLVDPRDLQGLKGMHNLLIL